MRILHFADLHLGVETYGRLNPETGLSTRFEDFLRSFDELVNYAVSSHVDVALFCGDAYKNREPTQTQQREFALRIKRLSESGITVFLLVGNHDLPNATGRATSTEIFATLAINNVYVASRPDVYLIPTKSGILQVAAIPWLRRSAILSREDSRGLDTEQIKQKMQQVLTGIVNGLAVKIDRGLPAVLAGHVWITGAVPGSERSMSLGNEHGLLLSSVASPVFDYVALGHIHKAQVLNTNPLVVYSGSLDRLDFGEESDDKGFCEVQLAPRENGSPQSSPAVLSYNQTDRHVSYSFHVINGRPFITIPINIEGTEQDPTASVVRAITAQPLKDAIVRIQITMPETGVRLNDVAIRQALKEAHYFTIALNISRETRLRLGRLTTTGLTPAEALKLWLENKKVSPERVKSLLEHAERLISGEPFDLF